VILLAASQLNHSDGKNGPNGESEPRTMLLANKALDMPHVVPEVLLKDLQQNKTHHVRLQGG